jgi:hypothetical protein
MEAESYQRVFRRVYRNILFVAAAGAMIATAWRGWRAGLLFLLGAGASYLSFSWLHQVVGSFGPDAQPTRKRIYVFFSLRYLLLGVAAYVIVKLFGVNAIAALAGLFVPVAAVTFEILYELVHGT